MSPVRHEGTENPVCLQRDQLLPTLPDGREAPGGSVAEPLTTGRLTEVSGRIGGTSRQITKIAVMRGNAVTRNLIENNKAGQAEADDPIALRTGNGTCFSPEKLQ